LRSQYNESNNLDPAYTCGQIFGTMVLIISMILLTLITDWIISKTGFITLFLGLSVFLLLHSTSLGFAIRYPKWKIGNPVSMSLKVNPINHVLDSVTFGFYFVFTSSLFFKLVYSRFGGFSNATSNYWDWLSFTLYSATDQISFGAVSMFLSGYKSIQATQTGQKIVIYLFINLAFTLLFWASFIKFCILLTKSFQKHNKDNSQS
jgi:hypothetical protein